MQRLTYAVLICCTFGLTPAVAQTEATSLDQLGPIVKPGQRLAIVDRSGAKTIGELIDVTDSAITISERDKWGTQHRRRFEQSTVQTIRKSDRLWNGLLIGAAAGFVASEVWTRQLCGPRGSDDECAAIVTAVGWVTMVPAGAVTGVLIDKFIGNTLLFRAPPTRANVAVTAVLRPSVRGVTLSVGF
jgi:hypothetical protein